LSPRHSLLHYSRAYLGYLPGILYVVATPIGNLEDITLRALRILREEVYLIACEDTRQTQKLLDHYGVRKPLISYHEHNELARVPEILRTLTGGENVALVSDAGTPLVSDPGYRVVSAAVAEGIPVVPLPGASALLSALMGSGLPSDEFWFVGFLPSKASARRTLLTEIAEHTGTVIAYESPHRILEALEVMAEVLKDRAIVLARELTKVYEEFIRGSAAEVRTRLIESNSVRGEMTLLIGKRDKHETDLDAEAELARLQEGGMSRIDAIKAVAKRMGLPKREVYRLAEGQGNNLPGKGRD
jgi:16S rRNA (cytidine1402-2'-O)-methyltransferase